MKRLVLLVSLLLSIPVASAHHGWGFYGEVIEMDLTLVELKTGQST